MSHLKGSLIKSVLMLATFFPSATASGTALSYEFLDTPASFTNYWTQVYAFPGGFMWGATHNGVARLDYDTFNLYTSASTSGGLPGDDILSVSADYKGYLWVMTDKGAAYYDSVADTFVPLLINGSTAPENVLAFSQIEMQGQLLLGGVNALYVYDYDSGTVEVKKRLDLEPAFKVHALYSGRNGNILLLDKDKGFLEYSLSSGEATPISVSITDNYAFMMDRYRRFWRSVYGKGVECFDSSCNLAATYTTSNSGLSCDVVNCIMEKGSDIWVGTELGGINIINPETGTIRVLQKDVSDPNSFPASSVSSLFCDQNGTVWAARTNGGVISIKETNSRSYFVSPSVSKGQPVLMSITAVLSESEGCDAWIGTFSAGIYRFDRNTGTLESCPSTAGMGITSIAQYGRDKLIFLASTKGLYLMDKRTLAITPFRPAGQELLNQQLYESRFAVNVENDYEGNVLILSDGIFKVVPSTGNMTRPDVKRSSHDALRMVEGSQGQDFFSRQHIHRWYAEQNELATLFDFGEPSINSVAVDRNGVFWVASDSGLYRRSQSDGGFTKIETTLFDAASVVACDTNGRVWVGSSEEMYIYIPESGSFLLTDSSDGIFPNEYSASAVTVSDDGHLLLGGSSCFTDIDGTVSFPSSTAPSISLLNVTIDDVPMGARSRLTLPNSYKKMTVRVFASESNTLRKKLFRFDVDSRWMHETISTDKPECDLRYHSGKYAVSVSCLNREGGWTEPVQVLEFTVKHPWYTSIGFILLVLIVLLAMAFVLWSYLIRKRKMALQHDADKERLRFLLNVSHELKTPLTLIIGPLERLMDEEEKGSRKYQRMAGIRRQALRMRTLILTVLDSHKIEEGAATLNSSPVDFNSWVDGVAADFKDEMENRDIMLERSYSPAIDKVPIDADKLVNVLTNILINAMKHSPNDSTVTIGTVFYEDRNMVRAFVSDQGSGLGGVDMTKLFGRYYQALTEKTGTGMGLAYSDSIVRLHGGQMGAYENPDRGSTFYFEIPVTSI